MKKVRAAAKRNLNKARAKSRKQGREIARLKKQVSRLKKQVNKKASRRRKK